MSRGGLAIITVGPSDMDEQLVQLFLGPNERFWGGRTVGPLWGTFVTSVPYRHGGGWSTKINAWYLNSLMVYL